MQAKLAGTLALALADMSAAVQVVYLDAQGTITIGDRARLYLKLRGRKINQGGQFARIVDPSRSKTIPQTNLLLPCCFWLTISFKKWDDVVRTYNTCNTIVCIETFAWCSVI